MQRMVVYTIISLTLLHVLLFWILYCWCRRTKQHHPTIFFNILLLLFWVLYCWSRRTKQQHHHHHHRHLLSSDHNTSFSGPRELLGEKSRSTTLRTMPRSHGWPARVSDLYRRTVLSFTWIPFWRADPTSDAQTNKTGKQIKISS